MIAAHHFLALSDASYGPLRRTSLLVVFAASLLFLILGIVVRRRAGQTWNEALAGGTKLLTGNVWLDGAIFAIVVAAIYFILRYVVFRAM